MDVAGHPGIDDVVDVVKSRRAHEKGRLVGQCRGEVPAITESGSHARLLRWMGGASMRWSNVGGVLTSSDRGRRRYRGGRRKYGLKSATRQPESLPPATAFSEIL